MDKQSFERVNMRDADYRETLEEVRRSGSLCFRINHIDPTDEEIQTLTAQLVPDMGENVRISPPMQIDMGSQITIGRNVFINHGLTVMSRGGVRIDDDVMIGPGVTLLTANHDLDDHWVLLCGGIRIGRNAWIGANATILPGVTIGENAVVGACAVVTKDVAANTVVGGNPAKVLRVLEPKVA